MDIAPEPLDERLQALARAIAEREPPASVDRAITLAIARSRRTRAAPRSRPVERWLAWPVALAASIALVSLIVRQPPPEPPASGGGTSAASVRFLPVVPDAEIARSTDAYIIPARMPRMALAGLGLPIDPARATDVIDADLLVRPDGAVLALRLPR